MTYATPAELLARFDAEEIAQCSDRGIPRLVTGNLLATAAAGGDLSGFTAEEQAAVAKALTLVNSALADADSDIDGYVSTRYTVPLAQVPAMIKRLACDLARYYLYDDQATETVKDRRDAAITSLGHVSAGKVGLGPVAGGESSVTPTPASNGVEMTSAPSVWRRESSEGFI